MLKAGKELIVIEVLMTARTNHVKTVEHAMMDTTSIHVDARQTTLEPTVKNITTVPPHHVRTKAHVQTEILNPTVLVLFLIRGPDVRPKKVLVTTVLQMMY